MNQKRILAVLVGVCLVGVLGFQREARAQGVVVYSGYGYYATPVYGAVVHSPPLYSAPGAVTYSPPYYYGGYAAPAPVAYGTYYETYYTPYTPGTPIGHALIAPRDGMEIEYKFKNGLWYVDVDD